MKISKYDMYKIKKLVGNISESNLKYVDCYVSNQLGLFIPSVGFCEYAITPQHTHPAYSFILFFSPEQSFFPLEMVVQSEHYLCMALSPSVPHEEKAADTFKRYLAIFIDKDFFELQFSVYSTQSPKRYIWKQFQLKQDIMLYIKKYMSEYENKLPGHENILDALATIITHQIIRNILQINTTATHITERLEIGTVIEYMAQHFGEKLSVGKLAKLANMSESHFIRVFKKETELPPMEYLIRLRIDKSKKLLHSRTKMITDIALECGFNSASHYSSCFAKHTGMSPSDYQGVYSR